MDLVLVALDCCASCLVRQPVVVKGLGRSASIDAVGGGAGSGW